VVRAVMDPDPATDASLRWVRAPPRPFISDSWLRPCTHTARREPLGHSIGPSGHLFRILILVVDLMTVKHT
jgi:hypothetical protein